MTTDCFCCYIRQTECIFGTCLILRDNYDSLTEIAEILALGLQRLLARQSSQLSAERGESSLHFQPDQSGAGSPISLSENP
jgi:hypothetical protein